MIDYVVRTAHPGMSAGYSEIQIRELSQTAGKAYASLEVGQNGFWVVFALAARARTEFVDVLLRLGLEAAVLDSELCVKSYAFQEGVVAGRNLRMSNQGNIARHG